MTVPFIKLTLRAAFLSYCLAAISTSAALAQSNQPAQEPQSLPAGKRKALHEYGPEDILPAAKENENTKPRKTPVQPLTTDNKTPRSPKPAISPTPILARAERPKATPAATPAELSAPVTAITPAIPQKTNSRTALRRKLLASSALFLLLLTALVFFVAKMLRQLRGGKEAVTAPTLEEPPATGRQLRLGAFGNVLSRPKKRIG